MAGTTPFSWILFGTLVLVGMAQTLASAGAVDFTGPVGAGVVTMDLVGVTGDLAGAGAVIGDLDTPVITTIPDIIPIIRAVGAITAPVVRVVRSIHRTPLEAEDARI
jgi:hypothetical protein